MNINNHLGTFFVKTYGCQMNEYDSQKISTIMMDLGLTSANDINNADIIIINTCHIREKATETIYSLVGRLMDEKKPNAKIIIAGCVAQAEGEEVIKRTKGEVTMIVGPQAIGKLPELISKILTGQNFTKVNLDFDGKNKFEEIPIHNNNSKLIAHLTIQEGCDKFCKFCCVPYTRGAEYSRSPEEIYREALILASNGAKMINLLGQNVNAYHGKDCNNNECNLAQLIKNYINKIPSFERIFYTTSHPMDMHEELFAIHQKNENLGGVEKLIPFVHLPIQSGSDKILKHMNRKHTRQQYFEIIDKFRSLRPDIAFSTDIIVGYPGETEQDFEDTIDLVSKVKFASAFYFKYSPRPGTPAANMEQIDEKIKSERFARLKVLLDGQQKEFNEQMINKDLEVLFEGKNHNNQFFGRSQYMQLVFIDDNGEIDEKEIIGKTLKVKITYAFGHSLLGKLEKICEFA